MKYVLAALAIVFGVFLIIKTEWFIQNFGTSAWAEQHLGMSGGTRLLYKAIGLLIIFLSFMAVTGLLGGFILGTFGRLFGIR